jgi:hypothetical protein
MKTIVISLLSLTLLIPTVFAVTVNVPGTSDLWLAGMPNGTAASVDDSAPGQSPLLVTGISITGGSAYSFQATGLVSVGPSENYTGPDGGLSDPSLGATPHLITIFNPGAENGIGNILAPYSALIGVFLGNGQPNLNPAPGTLDFSTSASLDYLTLSPQLQQPFFIGDGVTSLSAVQQVIAPAGATRLFLGTMDGYGWYDNLGSFTVQVVPEPGVIALTTVGLAALCLRRKVHCG